jgi:hypothetical protein
MKRIILTLTVAALAVAVQAGEGKTCSQAKAACAGKDKAACAAKMESGCCAKTSATANTTCPKKLAHKRWLMSPKAAGELAANK